ncbi:MAG: M15 family metallopeptidase [Patescibacteria group bacterium]
MNKKIKIEIAFGLMVLSASLIAFVVYGYYRYDELSKNLDNTNLDLLELQKNFDALNEERDYIYNNLLSEQAKNSLFENQIKEIAGTVGNLDKLSKTDEELLQKYSRVYFLNEHYVPESLATITPSHLLQEERVQYAHAKVAPYLEAMMKDMEERGTPILVVSAFRSFAEQISLKGKYLVTYGSGANQFSADQGFSEHQLGTAFDFTTVKLASNFTDFAGTESYKWLLQNAHKYGFILSYPKDNSYYQFEPWHWRFVGKKLALRLHEEEESFYDLDQRIINNYLLSIFD